METPEEHRTYGGWRRSRGMGLFGLGPSQTLAILAAVLLTLAAGSVSLTAVAVMALPMAVLIGLVVARWNDMPMLSVLAQRWRWSWGEARGQTSYRSGSAAPGRHAWSLPGVLAPTELLETGHANGSFGLVRHQRTGMLTATLKVAAHSTWLVDRHQADAWVANWGAWLAGLGYLPTVRWVAVTVTTGPGSGARLPDTLLTHIAPNAPAAAQRILRRLADSAPSTTADIRTTVSITFDPTRSPAKPRRLEDAVEEVSRTLPGLEDALAACGVTVLGRLTASELAAAVRAAYDPAARDGVDQLVDGDGRCSVPNLLDWSSTGPIAADEDYGHYRHDSAHSVSWAWHEAPRQHVYAEVLARLLAPGPHRKRVTLLYRPLPAAQAAKVVDREVNAAVFRDALRTAQRRDENARDRTDRDRALRAAREEATGAGFGLISLYAPTTVLIPEDLDAAIADVESRADIARIRLRRLWGSQSAGFATTLPCGICPPQLAATWPH